MKINIHSQKTLLAALTLALAASPNFAHAENKRRDEPKPPPPLEIPWDWVTGVTGSLTCSAYLLTLRTKRPGITGKQNLRDFCFLSAVGYGLDYEKKHIAREKEEAVLAPLLAGFGLTRESELGQYAIRLQRQGMDLIAIQILLENKVIALRSSSRDVKPAPSGGATTQPNLGTSPAGTPSKSGT